MKVRTPMTIAVFLAMLGGIGWLSRKNTELRHQLAASVGSAQGPAGQRTEAVWTTPGPTKPGLSPGVSVAGGNNRVPEPPLPKTSHRRTGTAENPGFVSTTDDGTVVVENPRGGPPLTLNTAEATKLTRELQSSLADRTARFPNGPSWSPGQAAGPPNTHSHGDHSTAWAAQSADGGAEWLKVKFENAVEIGEINIHESFNPGAVSKVSVILPDGSQKVIWEGMGSAETDLVERAIQVPPGVRSGQVLIELDTARVPGWNEIDAVEIVGRDGSRQWAAESTASSFYGQIIPGSTPNGLNLNLPAGFRSTAAGEFSASP